MEQKTEMDDNTDETEYEGIGGWLYQERYGRLGLFAFIGVAYLFVDFAEGTWLEGKFIEAATAVVVIYMILNGGSLIPNKKRKK